MHLLQYSLALVTHSLFGILLANYFLSIEYQTRLLIYSNTILSSIGIRQSMISENLHRDFEKSVFAATITLVKDFFFNSMHSGL